MAFQKTIKPKNSLLRKIIGIILVIIGIFGLIMPIIPGWLFLIPGMLILNVRWFKNYFKKINQRKVFNGEIKSR
jgi:uncharacterized membrane protein YbaN (DUF454 family)